jgi:hypothetical protein
MIMDNVTFIYVEGMDGLVEYAIIDHGNGDFTSMTKAEYDKEYPHGVQDLTDAVTEEGN